MKIWESRKTVGWEAEHIDAGKEQGGAFIQDKATFPSLLVKEQRACTRVQGGFLLPLHSPVSSRNSATPVKGNTGLSA
jgi:hypothetical protein